MNQRPSIALIDYGAGNLKSVAKALDRSGLKVEVTSASEKVAKADGVVLPGVGAFADAMGKLRDLRLDESVRRALDSSHPYLGLCLGLQLLFEESSEHGSTRGLEYFRGQVTRFEEIAENSVKRRVPHIGWNLVHFEGNHPMLNNLPDKDYFYFVHSYRAVPDDKEVIVGVSDYQEQFVSAVASETCFAAQFHPEKSQGAGRRLLDAFASWVRES